MLRRACAGGEAGGPQGGSAQPTTGPQWRAAARTASRFPRPLLAAGRLLLVWRPARVSSSHSAAAERDAQAATARADARFGPRTNAQQAPARTHEEAGDCSCTPFRSVSLRSAIGTRTAGLMRVPHWVMSGPVQPAGMRPPAHLTRVRQAIWRAHRMTMCSAPVPLRCARRWRRADGASRRRADARPAARKSRR
jgi:hypothetical protein